MLTRAAVRGERIDLQKSRGKTLPSELTQRSGERYQPISKLDCLADFQKVMNRCGAV
jgi:hypothetical protein